MAFVLVARMTARDGEQDRAAELIPQLVEATRTSPATSTTSPTAIPRTRASSSCTSSTATRRPSRSTARPSTSRPSASARSSRSWRPASATSTRRSSRARRGVRGANSITEGKRTEAGATGGGRHYAGSGLPPGRRRRRCCTAARSARYAPARRRRPGRSGRADSLPSVMQFVPPRRAQLTAARAPSAMCRCPSVS